MRENNRLTLHVIHHETVIVEANPLNNSIFRDNVDWQPSVALKWTNFLAENKKNDDPIASPSTVRKPSEEMCEQEAGDSDKSSSI